MKSAAVIASMLMVIALQASGCRAGGGNTSTAQATHEEMQRLADYEVDLVLRSDIPGMELFYPDDMITTNPFNQVIDKATI